MLRYALLMPLIAFTACSQQEAAQPTAQKEAQENLTSYELRASDSCKLSYALGPRWSHEKLSDQRKVNHVNSSRVYYNKNGGVVGVGKIKLVDRTYYPDYDYFMVLENTVAEYTKNNKKVVAQFDENSFTLPEMNIKGMEMTSKLKDIEGDNTYFLKVASLAGEKCYMAFSFMGYTHQKAEWEEMKETFATLMGDARLARLSGQEAPAN